MLTNPTADKAVRAVELVLLEQDGGPTGKASRSKVVRRSRYAK